MGLILQKINIYKYLDFIWIIITFFYRLNIGENDGNLISLITE